MRRVWSTHSAARHRHSTHFTAHSHALIRGSHAVRFVWHWGDGRTSTTSSAKTQHRYARSEARTVTLSATDNLHQVVIRSYRIRVR